MIYDECVICFDKKDLLVFKECGHQICCADCVKNLFQKNVSSSCPFCRKLISKPQNICILKEDGFKISDLQRSKKEETIYGHQYFNLHLTSAARQGRRQVFVPFKKNNAIEEILRQGEFRYRYCDDARGYQISW